MSEELKLQLAERMPGVISAMAEAGGYKDQAALFKAMEKGEVKAKDVLEKFAKILSDRARAGGALEEAMNTSTAQQARFNNAVTKLVEVMGDNGLETGMARIFKTFNDGLTESTGLGVTLGKLMARLSWAIKGVVGGVRVLGEGFTILANKLGISRDKLAMIALAAGMVLLPFGKIVLAATALMMILDDLKRWADGKDSFFKDLFMGLDGETQTSLLSLGESALKLKDAFVDLWENGGSSLKSFAEYLDESGIAGKAFRGFLSLIEDIIERLTVMVNIFSNIAGGNFAEAGKIALNFTKENTNAFVRNTLGAADLLLPGTPLTSLSRGMNSGIDSLLNNRLNTQVIGQQGYTVPDYLLNKHQDLTGDMLKDRVTRISNAGATGNITFGNVEVKIDVSGGLDTTNSEQIGKQIAEQFMREMEKTQIQFSETN